MNLRLGLAGVSALAILHASPGSASAQGPTNYTYDALGQLVSTTTPTGQTTTYTYDQAGNRTAFVSVTPPPTVGNINLSTPYNTAGSANLQIGGAYSSTALGANPSHGSASVSGTTATYTPTTGYYGSDSFTYTASGPGGTSNTGTVSVTVQTPPAPTVGNVSLSAPYNAAGSATLSISGVYTSVAASSPSHGSVSASGSTATYTPSSGYYGADSFTYTATGPGGTSNTGTVAVTVATPPAPTVANVGLSAPYNAAGSTTLAVSGVYSSTALASNPSHGSATVSGTTATYTPTSGYYGSDSFTYTATGPGGASNTGTVSVTVASPSAPTAGNVGLSTPYNTAGSVTLAPGGVYSSLALASNASHGSASVSGTTATYTPTSGYYGSDSFTYTASGPGGTSAAGTVSVSVGNPPAPTAGNVGLNVGYNTAGSVGLAPSGVYTSLALASNPSHGAASISGTTATYTPTSGYYGSDSFTYTVSGPGGSNSATVSVDVATPAAPTAGNVGLNVGYNTSGSVGLAPGGVYTSLSLGSNPSHGSASVSGATATYTPTSGYYGADSFTYTVSGPGGSNSATVSVNVATPPAPTAGNVGLNVGYNTAGSVGLAPSGVYTSLALGSQASHGTASVSGTTATYTPNSGYYGSDSFTYTVSGPGGSASATVSVNVATPAAPTAGNVGLNVGYNTAGSVTLAPGGVYSSTALGSQASHGTASVSGTTATYTPTSGYYGSDSFTYTASGPGGTSSAGTVSVTIATPPAPTAANVNAGDIRSNQTGTFNLAPSGVWTSMAVYSSPRCGQVTMPPAGDGATATFTATSCSGSVTFQYTAKGPGGTSSPATVTIAVIAE